MKYFAGIILLLSISTAAATECQGSGSWLDMRSNVLGVYADLQLDTVSRRIKIESNIILCRNNFASAPFPLPIPDTVKETISTVNIGIFPAGPVSHLEAGLIYGGGYYNLPVGSRVLSQSNISSPVALLPINMFVKLPPNPNQFVTINAGQHVGSFLIEVSYPPGFLNYSNYIAQIDLFAGNNIVPPPSVCTINNNAPLSVDFGSVAPADIALHPLGAPFSQVKALNYSCTGPSVTRGITIKLQGANSGFASNALATSNPDVGVVMLRTSSSAIVPPGAQFNASVINSSGGDNVTFALIRRSGSYPAAGNFTSSATLILGMP